MRTDRRRRRARANTRREWSPVPDETPSLSVWRHDRQVLNRLITASPDPFSSQDDSQVLTREQSPGQALYPGRPSQQPILRLPLGQDPSACGLFQPGYRNKHAGCSLLLESARSCHSLRVPLEPVPGAALVFTYLVRGRRFWTLRSRSFKLCFLVWSMR